MTTENQTPTAQSGPSAFRKRPVVIEAVQLARSNGEQLAEWCGGQWLSLYGRGDRGEDISHVAIRTLEGTMRAELGDWIIKGVAGEFYPCKPEIFAASYGPAKQPPAGARDAVTDEMVERACVAFYEDPATFLSLRPQPAAQISMRRDMRAALEAALAAQPAPGVGGSEVAGIEDALFDVIRGFGYTTSSQTGTIVYAITNNLDLRQLLSTRPAESVAQGGEWMLRLAKEIKANAEDHPGDYIAKFALAWADELAARAISEHPAPAGGEAGGG